MSGYINYTVCSAWFDVEDFVNIFKGRGMELTSELMDEIERALYDEGWDDYMNECGERFINRTIDLVLERGKQNG